MGALTVTIVGTYATLALAVAAMDEGSDAVATDWHHLIVLPNAAKGADQFAVIKYIRAA